MRRHTRVVWLAALSLLAPACGGNAGPVSSLSATVSTSTPGPTPVPPTPAPATPAPLADVVWVIGHNTGPQDIRLVPGSGAPRTVATISADAQVLAAGHGKVVAVDADHTTIRVVDLGTGASTTFAGGTGGSGEIILGGTLSPGGSHFAYVDAVVSTAYERIADLGAGTVTTVRTITDNQLDVPVVWAAAAVGALTEVGFADAGPQAAQSLDGTTLARTLTTADSGTCAVVISDDALHAADTIHSPLGDEADASPGPGPPRPCNTLRAFSIGGAPAMIVSEAHHTISVIAASGSTLCFSDDPAAGGFAGATLHPDLGLFLLQGGSRRQLAHWDASAWTAGAFIAGGLVAAHGQADGGGPVELERFDTAGARHILDTVADGTASLVAVA